MLFRSQQASTLLTIRFGILARLVTITQDSARRLILTSDFSDPPVMQATVSEGGHFVLWNKTQTNGNYQIGDFKDEHELFCDKIGEHKHDVDGGIATPVIDTSTASAGSGAAFDNRPAYYELAYIIKL